MKLIDEFVNGVEIFEVYKISEKIKWNKRFVSSYSGNANIEGTNILDKSRVFVATSNGLELGYIRISDVTSHFEAVYEGEVFRLNEAYVKPPYRGRGVLTLLRRYVVEHCNVKFMKIEAERYSKLSQYFYEEGFSKAFNIVNSHMVMICLYDFLGVIRLQNRKLIAA